MTIDHHVTGSPAYQPGEQPVEFSKRLRRFQAQQQLVQHGDEIDRLLALDPAQLDSHGLLMRAMAEQVALDGAA